MTARSVAATGPHALARVTGVVVNPFVIERVAEDARNFWAYARSSAARRAEDAASVTASTPDAVFAFSCAHFGEGPIQRPVEINGLLGAAGRNGSRTVCEIGTRDAGTSVLFSRVLQPELLIVMDLYVRNRWRLRRHAPNGQIVKVIDGNSTHPVTTRRLRRSLGSRAIDLLLIDGDHSWDGVRNDFFAYRHFVRDGGLIAFHDINDVSDQTVGLWVGGVPKFWRAIRSCYAHEEFVETPGQQGFGIGVIKYDPTVKVDALSADELSD